MREEIVDGIELTVGLACAVAAIGAWRQGLRWAAAVAGVAALGAGIHAGWALAS